MKHRTSALGHELRALLLTRCTAEEQGGYRAQIAAEGLDETVRRHAAIYIARLGSTAVMVRGRGLDVFHGGSIPGERLSRALERDLVARVPGAFPDRAARIMREPLKRGWWAVVVALSAEEDLP